MKTITNLVSSDKRRLIGSVRFKTKERKSCVFAVSTRGDELYFI
jgi:hypothetical protein